MLFEKNKKFITRSISCFLVAAALLFSLSFQSLASNSYEIEEGEAAFSNNANNSYLTEKDYGSATGNNLADVALGQMSNPSGTIRYAGSYEGYYRDVGGKRNEYNNKNGENWCVYFVTWCADKAGIGSNIIPRGIYSVTALEPKLWDCCEVVTSPKAGDLVVYPKRHIGIMINEYESIQGNVIYNGQSRLVKFRYSDYTYDGVPKFYRPKYDNTPPVITNVQVTNITSGGYTISCDIYDNEAIKYITFNTWAEGEDENNPKQDIKYGGNGSYSQPIKISDHGGKSGKYYTKIYVEDQAGNSTVQTQEINVPPAEKYTINYINESSNIFFGILPVNKQASQSVDSGKNVILKSADECGFTKSGYTFKEWNTKKDGTGKSYKGKSSVFINDLVKPGSKKVDLYAQWEAKKYNVVLAMNDGTIGIYNSFQYTKGDKDISLNSKYSDPVRKGYIFDGWYTSRKGGDKISKIKTSKAEDVVLYAHWKEDPKKPTSSTSSGGGSSSGQSTNAKYTIRFDGNYADNGVMQDLTNRTAGKKVTLPKNLFTKSGYIFDGWTVNQDGTGTKYADMATISSLSSVNGAIITLYAQWKTVPLGMTVLEPGTYRMYPRAGTGARNGDYGEEIVWSPGSIIRWVQYGDYYYNSQIMNDDTAFVWYDFANSSQYSVCIDEYLDVIIPGGGDCYHRIDYYDVELVSGRIMVPNTLNYTKVNHPALVEYTLTKNDPVSFNGSGDLDKNYAMVVFDSDNWELEHAVTSSLDSSLDTNETIDANSSVNVNDKRYYYITHFFDSDKQTITVKKGNGKLAVPYEFRNHVTII